MTKRFCKTYIKTIPKYIEVPPILNFLYGSFSAAWVIYFTARIISTLIRIYIHISKKNCHFIEARLFPFMSLLLRSRFDSRSRLNFCRYLFNQLDNVHLTARIISIFITVSYCNVFLGFTVPRRSKVHLNMRTAPCFACFLSFLLIQFVQLMNDPLRQ